MMLASQLALEGFRVVFGRRRDGARPFVARRGSVVVHAPVGAAPRVEISPPRVTVSV